jgi:hypothetical protein
MQIKRRIQMNQDKETKEKMELTGDCGCGPACCGPSGSSGSGKNRLMFYGVVIFALGVAVLAALS